MSDSPKRVMKGMYCADCRGHRLHQVNTVAAESGKVTRNMICSACEVTTRLGVCCPRCADVRLHIVTTRHWGNTTVRLKKCLSCGHRVRTRETVETAG